jgi:hypothetical protein
MVLNLPLDECIDNTHNYSNLGEKQKKKRIKRNFNKRTKAKQSQTGRSLEKDKSRNP